jgi:signal transduction histidine kinase
MPRLLAEGLNARVDYYTEYLDFLRFPQPEYESVYLDFLRRKYEGRRFDLLLLMGDAIDFLRSSRNELFGDTPAVFYSISPLRNPLANSTGLINELHFRGSIDLALALQPDLERVYVVSGAGASDRSFESRAKAEFRTFEGRVEFIYFSGLVTKDLEERLRTLPPNSAVYFVAASRDGAGEPFQMMTYLSRVAAAANAPTYSWADAAVETGIVGGSRRDQQTQMKAIATLALRVLRGERADDIPVSAATTDVNSVDWRQLRRWGLDEARLPSGVRVLFREPSAWDRYQRYIIGAVILMLAQASLIAGLLVQRTKRRRIELKLRGSQAKLRGSYDRIRQLTRRLLGEQEAERARIARELHDDINQQLAVLSIEIDRLRSDQLPVHSADRLARVLETAQGISNSVRELSHRLHPSRLRLIGLVASLDNLRHDLSLPHLSIDFQHRDVPAEIDQQIELCLFRVAQEALGNAVRHSDASHLWIELTGGPSSVTLTFTDDGKGFDVDGEPNAGLGLISMRERVESVGGTLEIHATPPSGTRLRVTVPTHAPESAPAGTLSV